MAIKEHAGIGKLAQKVVYAVAVANGRQALGPEELRAAEAELDRALGPILEAADAHMKAMQITNTAKTYEELRAALKKFNQGE